MAQYIEQYEDKHICQLFNRLVLEVFSKAVKGRSDPLLYILDNRDQLTLTFYQSQCTYKTFHSLSSINLGWIIGEILVKESF